MCVHMTNVLYADIGVMQETLLNLLLRNYLHYNLYDQAEKLRSKAPRFEAHSNQQVTLNCFNYKAICPFHLGITGMKDMVDFSVGRPVAYLELQY